MTVSLIVHGNYSYIRAALQCVLATPNIINKVYVTINSGASEEASLLQNDFPNVSFLINDKPLGFATNHNRVLSLANTPYIALLNDDITFTPDTLPKLIKYLEENSRIGLVTPRILNPDGTSQITAYNDPTLFKMVYKISGLGYFTRQGSWIRDFIIRSGLSKRLNIASINPNTTTRVVPVIVGTAMIVRQKTYAEAGGMDEDTLVYGEEIAWHLRVRQHGWELAVVGDASITHFNVKKPLTGWRLGEQRKSILNYYCRYRPRWQELIIRIVIVIIHSIYGLFNLIFDREHAIGDWLSVKYALIWSPSTQK